MLLDIVPAQVSAAIEFFVAARAFVLAPLVHARDVHGQVAARRIGLTTFGAQKTNDEILPICLMVIQLNVGIPVVIPRKRCIAPAVQTRNSLETVDRGRVDSQ